MGRARPRLRPRHAEQRAHLPDYMGNASRGSKNDREVAERFVAKPKAMHELAGSIHELSKPSVSWNVTQYCPMTAETDIARGRRSDRRGGGTAKTFLTSARKQPGYSRSSPVMSCAPRRFSGCRSSLTSWSQSRWKWPSWTSRASRGKSETRAQAAGPPAQGHGGGTVPGMHPGGHRVRR